MTHRATTVTASVPVLDPPAWALSQRALLDLLDSGWRLFSARYTRPDGSLRYEGRLSSRDGADDFFEPFFNWPQLYLLGGADDLLETCARHWHGVVAQMTGLGMFADEFEIGYDWFHQGESLLFTYFLTAADPVAWTERATRFADLYLFPAKGNYDPDLRIIKAPHNGSRGARRACPTRPPTRGPRRRPPSTATRSTGWCPATRPCPLWPGTRGSARRCSAAWAVATPSATSAWPAWSATPTSPAASGATPTGCATTSAPGSAGPRRTAASCPTTSASTASSAVSSTAGGTAATTAGPGRTACTASARRRPSARSAPPWPPATTATSASSAPCWTRSSSAASSWPSTRATRPTRAAGAPTSAPTHTCRRCSCPTGTATRAGSTTTRSRPRCPSHSGTTPARPRTVPASTRCGPPPGTTGRPCGPSATRRRPGTRSRGTRTCAATTRTTPSGSWRPRTPRPAAASRCCSPTPAATCRRRPSTCGRTSIRW
ncbi:hypothetical protein ACFQ0B_43260 [Nonomuraea thailandensis]